MSRRLLTAIMLAWPALCLAQVPGIIHYQGRISVAGTNFTGTGQFRFALVDGAGAVTYWSNGVDSVVVPVSKGLYSVMLGDAGMDPLPSGVFTNSEVRLRVWFAGEPLVPDQRIAAVGYALMAANVPDGLVTTEKLADGAVTSAKLAAGAVGASQLATGMVGAVHLSAALANAVVPWQVNGGLTPLASANSGYLLTNAALTELLLPVAANVGDVVRVSGVGVGGWQIAPNAGQSIAGYSAALSCAVTWTARAGAGQAYYGLAMDADGSTIVGVASYNGQIWISHDFGTNWLTKGEVGYWWAAACSADGSKLAVLGGTGYPARSIYTSVDGGTNWVVRDSPRIWNSIACSADGSKLVASVSGGQLYTSTDAGTNWTAREQNRSWSGVASSADGMKLAATASGGQIYTSTDGGITWTARMTNQNWAQIASSADGTRLFTAVTGGHLYTSSDSGLTWTQRGNTGNWLYVASSGDGNRLMVNDHGNPGYLYLSIDGGITWTQKATGRYWHQVAISSNGKQLGAATDRQGGIYLSSIGLTGMTVSGAQGTTAALQYLGNGVWQPLNEALVGAGAVGTAQLASSAVQTINIATGAVGLAQQGAGAVHGWIASSVTSVTGAVVYVAGRSLFARAGLPSPTGAAYELAPVPAGTHIIAVELRDGTLATQQVVVAAGQVLENVNFTFARYFRDADGDNHGSLAVNCIATAAPAGYVSSSDDCDDANAQRYPGAAELCDGIDNDCDGQTDEGCATEVCGDGIDNDGDGQTDEGCATEVCGDGIDNDGDGQTDEGCATEICGDSVDNDGDGLTDEGCP